MVLVVNSGSGKFMFWRWGAHCAHIKVSSKVSKPSHVVNSGNILIASVPVYNFAEGTHGVMVCN